MPTSFKDSDNIAFCQWTFEYVCLKIVYTKQIIQFEKKQHFISIYFDIIHTSLQK